MCLFSVFLMESAFWFVCIFPHLLMRNLSLDLPEIFLQMPVSFVPGEGTHLGDRRSPSLNPVQGRRLWHSCPLLSADPAWTVRPWATLMPLPESRTGLLSADCVPGFCTSRHAAVLPDPPACHLAWTEKFAGRLWIMFLSSASSASHIEFLLPSQIC